MLTLQEAARPDQLWPSAPGFTHLTCHHWLMMFVTLPVTNTKTGSGGCALRNASPSTAASWFQPSQSQVEESHGVCLTPLPWPCKASAVNGGIKAQRCIWHMTPLKEFHPAHTPPPPPVNLLGLQGEKFHLGQLQEIERSPSNELNLLPYRAWILFVCFCFSYFPSMDLFGSDETQDLILRTMSLNSDNIYYYIRNHML